MKFIWTLLALLVTTFSFGQSFREEAISSRLMERIDQFPDAQHSFFIVLKDRVDAQALNESLRARRAGLAQRSQEVITILRAKAEATQGPILQYLAQHPEVQPGSIKPYWITNMIFAEARASVIASLSHHPDVDFLDWNAPLAKSSHEKAFSMQTGVSPGGKEPGLTAIKAPALWAMGYTGYGRVAFTNDTGVDPTHPAVASHFRGFYGAPGNSWFEFNSTSTDPYDCDDHGTHVTGTILGLDRLNHDTIGVAFNAKWVGASTIGCGNGFGNQDNIAAFQWAADPDGNPATFEEIPDAINNSWYDPSIDNDCTSVYVDVLNALDAIGVAVIFSAGNEGPGVQTITPPHNINTDIVNSFTVGAVNGNIGSLPIADFSSRGPSNCGGEGSLLIKPEVSAPGVSVRSCVPGGYAFFNGTSMAAPHVTGAVLLLREAFPYLPGHEIKLALYYTAIDLGDPGEDNTYGMGIIDVEQAFNYLIAQGHIPAQPDVNTDALVISLEAEKYQCEEMVSGRILLENAGLTTIHAMEVSMSAGAATEVAMWSGTLEPMERVWIELPGLSVTEGETNLSVEILSVNGEADDRDLNNRYVLPVVVKDRPFLEATVEAGEGMNICEGATVALRGSSTSAAAVSYKWYDAPSGGNLLGEGEVFLAGPLTEDATFYVDASYSEKVGLTNRYTGASQLGNLPDKEGLIFDAHVPFKIKTVKVYCDVAGPRILKLLDSEGNSIKTKAVVISETGEVTVNMNMTIPEGTGLQLVLDSGLPFYYNTSGPAFPYAVEDVLTIRRSNGPNGLQRWYYFYDWEIEYDEICGRTPVPVTVDGQGALPVASFEASADTVLLTGGTASVAFTDQSTGATSWHWNFGDGNQTAEQNPVHVFTSPGIYTVSLSAGSPDGCMAAATRTILVESDLVSVSDAPLEAGLRIFPNPASDVLHIEWEAEAFELQIFDLQGRKITGRTLTGHQTQVSLDGLSSGLYFVSLRTDKGVVTARFQVVR